MPNERHYNELNLESVGINLPYNMQAEQSVLGAVLLKPETLTDLVEIIRPEMFYTRQNAQIYSEMLRLFTSDQTIDFVTLLDAVISDGVFPSADEAKVYLTGLAETVPSISNVKAYAQIVQEKYLVRQLMGVAKDILQDAGDEPEDVTDSLERMGFTCEEMAEYGFEGVAAEDDFPYEEDEAPAVVNVDMAASFMQPPVKRDSNPLRFEDYTLEECPNCESEVIIRATGISRCPRCGKPILPCTTCSSCTTPCPYGYTGRFNERLKPTNPPITQREVDFYMSELSRRKER